MSTWKYSFKCSTKSDLKISVSSQTNNNNKFKNDVVYN